MSMRKFTASVLGLGLFAAIPAVANADRRPDPRDNPRDADRPIVRREEFRDVRHEPVRLPERPELRRDDVHDDFVRRPERFGGVTVRVDAPPPIIFNEDVIIPLNETPGGVIATADRERHGWPIASIERVYHNGVTFYRVRIERRHDTDLILTVQPDGDLLTRLSA